MHPDYLLYLALPFPISIYVKQYQSQFSLWPLSPCGLGKVILSFGLAKLSLACAEDKKKKKGKKKVPLSSCISPCFPDEFQNFVRRLPTFYALNSSTIQYFWKMEPTILQRYKQLELSGQQLVSKAQRIVNKLFILSKRCQTQPKIIMLKERSEADEYSY